MKIFLTIVLVAVVWNAVIATIQFVQQRKKRSKKGSPKIGDLVEILSGEFKGCIGWITGIGANHNNSGFYCWVMRPVIDGSRKVYREKEERYLYPEQVKLLM